MWNKLSTEIKMPLNWLLYWLLKFAETMFATSMGVNVLVQHQTFSFLTGIYCIFFSFIFVITKADEHI